jgi:hypothetical protein
MNWNQVLGCTRPGTPGAANGASLLLPQEMVKQG